MTQGEKHRQHYRAVLPLLLFVIGMTAVLSGDTQKIVSPPRYLVENIRLESLLPSIRLSIPDSYFHRAAFIGDSRTEGLLLYNGLTKSGHYAARSLTVDGFFRRPVISSENGEKITVAEAIRYQDYDVYYLMFGINELSWSSEQAFITRYEQMIDTIRYYHPGKKIIVQSILPVSAERSANDPIHNNPNIQRFNQLIEEMCIKKFVYYVDVGARFTDTNGALFADAGTDGIHLNKRYCQMWLDYLKEQAARGI